MSVAALGMVICLNIADVKRYEVGKIRPKSQANSCLVLDKKDRILEIRETRRYRVVSLLLNGHQRVTGYTSL